MKNKEQIKKGRQLGKTKVTLMKALGIPIEFKEVKIEDWKRYDYWDMVE